MNIDGSILKLRQALNQDCQNLYVGKLFAGKGQFLDIPFKRNESFVYTKLPLADNYKLALSSYKNHDCLQNSWLKDFLLIGCDVNNVDDYRNWIYVWKFLYHELTLHIRDVKKLRSVKYAGKSSVLNKVLKDAGITEKYVPDKTFPRMKDEAANYATLMILSRANMKALFKLAHPKENKIKQVVTLEAA